MERACARYPACCTSEEVGRSAPREPFAVRLQHLLLVLTAIDGSSLSRARYLHCRVRILHFDSNLIFQLLQTGLHLAELQRVTHDNIPVGTICAVFRMLSPEPRRAN